MTETEGRTLLRLADRVMGLGRLMHSRRSDAFAVEMSEIAAALRKMGRPVTARTPTATPNTRGTIRPGTRAVKRSLVRVEVRNKRKVAA